MLDSLNKMVKKMDVLDIGLLKLTVIVATIVIVKLFPQLLSISYPVLIIIAIILAIRPFYSCWLK